MEEPTNPRGVPLSWVNGGDFVQVSAEMTRALDGDFIAAGVAGRIRFVARLMRPDEDGMRWVDTPATKIAEDMGLSVKQVRRALTVLEDHGYIVRANRGNSWDRTLSVALIYREQADIESPASAL